MNIVSIFSDRSLNQLSYCKNTRMQLRVASHALLFDVENGFIVNEISINLLTFVQSVGWKVRKHFIHTVCQCLLLFNL